MKVKNKIIKKSKYITLHYSYTDWLVIQLRPLRKQTFSLTGLKVDYLRSGSFQNNLDPYEFCTLLQFNVWSKRL